MKNITTSLQVQEIKMEMKPYFRYSSARMQLIYSESINLLKTIRTYLTLFNTKELEFLKMFKHKPSDRSRNFSKE